ncbi:FliH/SctL family protein [Campylobacter canadensis]|nr:FliH/SctL family protein [Campylobacter canadensis]MBZ7997803.1 hypothetical protein [Campylobacter canadensis]
MMKSIINNNNKNKEHFIQPYKFKILNTSTNEEEPVKEEEHIAPAVKEEEKEENIVKEEAIANIQVNNQLNEDLLKKLDELGDNVIKLQMKLEKQEQEFNTRLLQEIEVAKKNAYAEGLNAGLEQNEAKLNELSLNVSTSVKKLDAKLNEISTFLDKTQIELNEAAYLIAKEVINKELSDNSSKIALAFAKTLIKDINKDLKIKISVNPNDYNFLKQELSSNLIEILSDDAVNKGCLVLNSDNLNTQINLKDRLAHARSIVLDENSN